jgi:hypothetical protein
VRTWLAQRPRIQVHYTPTYSSWLNQVERWFGLITQQDRADEARESRTLRLQNMVVIAAVVIALAAFAAIVKQ